MARDCLYSILGIERSASEDEIKKAFRARALESHPDKQSCPKKKEEAEQTFKELNRAYHILSDSQRRSAYDNGKLESNFSDMFSQMFTSAFVIIDEDLEDIIGRSSFDNKKVQRRVVSVPICVTLKDVYKGARKAVHFDVVSKCLHCEGYGIHDPLHDILSCISCGGSGKSVSNLYGGLQLSMTCISCAGRGKMLRTGCKQCKICSGAGKQKVKKSADIYLNRGCRENEIVHSEEHVGTVYEFKTMYKLDENTRVKDRDVHMYIPITLLELIGGFSRTISIGGVRRILKSSTYFDPQKPKKIVGGGLPDKDGTASSGNLYIHWRVIMPESKTKDARTLKDLSNVFQTGSSAKFTCKLTNDTPK